MAESIPQPSATKDRPRAGYKRSSETRARILEAALAEEASYRPVREDHVEAI